MEICDILMQQVCDVRI